MKTLTLTGDENTPAMPMTEAQVTHRPSLVGPRSGLDYSELLDGVPTRNEMKDDTKPMHQSLLPPAENKFHVGNGDDGKHWRLCT